MKIRARRSLTGNSLLKCDQLRSNHSQSVGDIPNGDYTSAAIDKIAMSPAYATVSGERPGPRFVPAESECQRQLLFTPNECNTFNQDTADRVSRITAPAVVPAPYPQPVADAAAPPAA